MLLREALWTWKNCAIKMRQININNLGTHLWLPQNLQHSTQENRDILLTLWYPSPVFWVPHLRLNSNKEKAGREEKEDRIPSKCVYYEQFCPGTLEPCHWKWVTRGCFLRYALSAFKNSSRKRLETKLPFSLLPCCGSSMHWNMLFNLLQYNLHLGKKMNQKPSWTSQCYLW